MRKFLSLLFVLIMAGAFFAACGGDDDDNTNASDTTENADNSNDNGGDDAGNGDDDSGDDDSSGSEELDKLLEMQSDAHIKIVYEVTGDMASEGDDEEVTVIQDGKDRSAWIQGNSSFYNIDGKTISCDSLDSEPTCTELPEGLGDLAAMGPLTFLNAIGQALLQAGDELDGLDKHDEELAGRDVVCVEYSAGALLGGLADLTDEDIPDDAGAKICVDKETGFVLEFSGTGDGQSGSYKAKEVSEPEDSDFEPPADVEENPLGDLNLDELTVPDDN